LLSSAAKAISKALKRRSRVPISKHVKQVASTPSGTPESAELAESLLRTMERGDVTRLKAELDRVEGVWRHRAAFSSKNSEQLELLTAVAGEFASLSITEARRQIKDALAAQGLIAGRQPTLQTIRVHLELIVMGEKHNARFLQPR